jgi:hypothetical protein
MTRILSGIALAALGALVLAACGERPQTISYKQGAYQGKPDTPPYQAQFNNNRQQWENEIKTRNQVQNEYRRVP